MALWSACFLGIQKAEQRVQAEQKAEQRAQAEQRVQAKQRTEPSLRQKTEQQVERVAQVGLRTKQPLQRADKAKP